MAFCPVCTVAVAGGAGLCRWLGIDDAISGVWVGGMLASLAIWFKARSRFLWLVMAVVLYSSVIIPLRWLGLVGGPHSAILGVDRFLVGIASGSIALLVGNWLYSFLKKTNNGRVYIPFQKVVVPVLCLTAASGVFYLLTCCI